MKITVIFLLSACMAASANGFSQRISLSEKNAPLQTIFEKIEKQSDYTFAYAINQLAVAKKISIEIVDGTLEEVLQICFKDQPFTYAIIEKTIVVKPKPEYPEKEIANVIPSIDISGKITNEEGEPLERATIKVKGTEKGTTTNSNGEFVLKGVDENAVLEISYVGYHSMTVAVNNRSSILASLRLQEQNLNEVIINKGYYTEKQKTSTSNVATVTAKDIEKQPVQNVLLALQARVPGLFIVQNSGLSGSAVKINVQGQNSIANGSDPLYVVDGVPIDPQLPSTGNDWMLGNSGYKGFAGWGNPLNYLNPGDIESVDILKDADATAIYGSRAANGAILITTKKGKAGEMKFDVNMQAGIGRVARRVDMMNTRQYLDMRYEAFANDGINWRDPSVSANDLKVWDTTHYTNWQNKLLGGTANYTNLTASLSGGSTNVRYLVSGSYHKETTVFPLSDDFSDKKGMVHFNINASSNNQKFKMQFSGNFMADKNQLPQYEFTQTALLLEPNAPSLLNADGSINWAPDANGNTTLSDANVMIQKYLKYVNKTYNLVSGLNLEYNIMPGLKIGSSFGYNYMQTNDYSPTPLIAVAPEQRATAQRNASFGNRNIQSWIIEPQASYSTKINKGKLELLVGSTFQDKKANANSIFGTGQLSDELLNNISVAARVVSASSSDSRYKYNAVFGRLNYNWSDKYIVNFNARRDGSTRFGADNRFHNFGSAGAAWVFSNEKFFSSNANLGFVNFGKLRASYGTTGSDQIGDYQFMSLYSIGNANAPVPYQGIVGLVPTSLPTPNLQWEETKKLQAGIDLGFLQDRIVFNATYVRNRSSNQLLLYALPNTSGITNYLTNFPAVIQNKNWEFSVTGKVLQKKNLSWTSSFNLTIPQNKLVSFPNLSTSTYANTLFIGKPIDVTAYYHWAGVAEGTGDYLYTTRDGHLTLAPNSDIDRTSLISRFPKFYGGFQNSISYKSIQLDFIFQFVKQTGYNDFTYGNGSFIAYPGMFVRGNSNQPVTVLDRWQETGDKTSVARFGTSAIPYIIGSDRRFTDLSYISLCNVSLSWDLPKKWMDKMHSRNCKLYLHGQNLLTITKYKGLSPETQSLTNIPALQIWMVGVQMGL